MKQPRLGIALAGLPSHNGPIFHLTKTLLERGIDVVIFGDPRTCQAPPAPLVPLDMSRMVNPRLLRFLVGEIAETALDLFDAAYETVGSSQISHLLFEPMSGWGRLVAERLGLPAGFVTTAFPQTTASMKARAAPAAPDAEQGTALATLKRVGEALEMRGASRLRVSDLFSLDSRFAVANVAPSLLADRERDLVVSAGRLGTALVPRDAARSLTRPRVLACFGSTFSAESDDARIDAVISACNQLKLETTISGAWAAAHRPALTGTVSIVPRVDQVEELARTDIFITHGGVASVLESCECGVPMLVMPKHADTALSAEGIERAAIGITCHGEDAASVRSGLERLLADYDEVASRTRAVGRECVDLRARAVAASAVEKWMTGERS